MHHRTSGEASRKRIGLEPDPALPASTVSRMSKSDFEVAYAAAKFGGAVCVVESCRRPRASLGKINDETPGAVFWKFVSSRSENRHVKALADLNPIP